GTVESIDVVGRTVEIKKNGAMADAHPSSVFVHRVIPAEEQAAALLRLGRWVADNGVDAAGAFRAARDLLLRRVPRREASLGSTPLVRHGESTLDAAKRVALELDRGVLAIQGPPGAGKTFTGARMICELVRAGKKVGITALSHKVIRNLLDEAVDAAEQQRLLIRCTQKVKDKPAKWDGDPIREVGTNKAVVDQLASGEAQVGAGTSWLWAREEMFEAVDVLFVDEAGQMSLANVLAVSQAAKSVVLLGDPQQLEQPLQGSHPDGTEASALHHLLGDRKTIATDAGLFLPETWRLAPSICSFTSELFYEGRLRSREDLAGQLLEGPETLAGAGLLFAPVVHDGNSSSSREEVARVAEIWEHLTSGVVAWQDRKGRRRPIRAKDVLVVAPYNAQVGAIGERLPDARVGTVDKFQGQEAPVVIYSMATSTPDEAPRGMEFLYSLNRLNVATSRARCMCILVANPRLFEPECRTPRQMQLANAFCRYLELARTI
ncbi:MAG: AAA family ATPase, partial [Microthrixaceae bacterium]|nr:AAA family ATPase [Microthrixaceae bacterium]